MSEHDYRHDEEKSDIIWGADAIAKFLNLGERQVFYLAQSGKLPCFKLGSKWGASKAKLLAIVEASK